MDVQEYFGPHEGYFWQWEESGEVVAIPGGNTIAYKEFIEATLNHLSDGGLPPFGSLLLSLIATNPESDPSLFAVRLLMEKLLDGRNPGREPLNSALSFLQQLSALPKKYKSGKNRLLLLHTLFTDCHNRVSPFVSKVILKAFGATQLIGTSYLVPRNFYFNLYHEDFTVISLLGRKFTTNDILIQKLADLPLMEEEIPLEDTETPPVIEKDFIESLVNNDKTFHIGSLVKRLWSGLNIPYHNTLPSQQPLGGVSDLSNKGDFHHLLISEFANDDVLFLSRLANNEALYINREVPPQANNLERIILIDVSIKAWGTPKAVAYAIMLAIAKHPKTDIPCAAYAVGESYYPLHFNTVHEVIDSLQMLEPCLHSAAGLAKFFKENSKLKNKELFFIASVETLRQPALHKALSDHYASFSYWIHTDDKGGIDLYKRQQSSKRHVQHLQLNLEELWKKKPNEQPVKLILNQKTDYPILFPAASNPKQALAADGELFLITGERSLIRSYDSDKRSGKGWQLLYEGLPAFNGPAEIGIHEDGKISLLLFNEANKKLTLVDAANNRVKSIEFLQWKKGDVGKFIFSKEKFIFFRKKELPTYWTFYLEEEVIVKEHESISPMLYERFVEKQNEPKNLSYRNLVLDSVFKNISSVFINEVDNLVFNRHELRLTDQQVIYLDKTGFLKKEIIATTRRGHEFRFPDGSIIKVNRSGMLILKSSDASIPEIYVPSVVSVSLGIATVTDFAGNMYYQLPTASDRSTISPQRFWMQYMKPFINTIKQHGT